MKREILDAVKRWYQYDWLAIDNKLRTIDCRGHLGLPFPVRR